MKRREFFDKKRKWSTYKDKLLEKYLPIYFSKILTSHKNTTYIDGFAGVGKFDDGTEGSPIIASRIIQNAIDKTKGKGKITAYFIEYEFAEELKRNLGCHNVIPGDFKIEVPKIIDSINDENVFLYADPFGIKHLKFNIIKKLGSQNIHAAELLLNLNAFGFLREGCRLLGIRQDEIPDGYEVEETSSEGSNSIENMNAIANGDYWIKILTDKKLGNIDMKEAEERFVSRYINELRKIFRFVNSIPIRTGEKNIPKYRMIFGSNNIDGMLLMSDAMLFCDRELRLFNNKQQLSLFDYYDTQNCDDAILGCLSYNFTSIKEMCLSIYKQIGVIYSHKEIQDTLKKLEASNKIFVKRWPSCTSNGRPAKALTIMNREYKIEVKKIV